MGIDDILDRIDGVLDDDLRLAVDRLFMHSDFTPAETDYVMSHPDWDADHDMYWWFDEGMIVRDYCDPEPALYSRFDCYAPHFFGVIAESHRQGTRPNAHLRTGPAIEGPAWGESQHPLWPWERPVHTVSSYGDYVDREPED
jgi:hypothetical protein